MMMHDVYLVVRKIAVKPLWVAAVPGTDVVVSQSIPYTVMKTQTRARKFKNKHRNTTPGLSFEGRLLF